MSHIILPFHDLDEITRKDTGFFVRLISFIHFDAVDQIQHDRHNGNVSAPGRHNILSDCKRDRNGDKNAKEHDDDRIGQQVMMRLLSFVNAVEPF